MANYLYKTFIYTNTANVIGLDETENATHLADYEGNHQADTISVDDIQIAETTFVTDMEYDNFHDLIVTPFDWGDVREVEKDNHYALYLITTSPL